MSEREILVRDIKVPSDYPTTEEEIEDSCIIKEIPIFKDCVRDANVGELEIFISYHPTPETYKGCWTVEKDKRGFYIFEENDNVYAIKIWLVPESRRKTVWPVDATNLDWHHGFIEWVKDAALEEFREEELNVW